MHPIKELKGYGTWANPFSRNKMKTIIDFILGLYFYIEASGRNMGEIASLESPYIQSNGNATCMVFYYHLYGHSIGSLRIKVGDKVLWQLSGNQGNSWYKATVPLNFDGTYKVR